MQSAENKLPGLNSVLKFSAFATCGVAQDSEVKKKKDGRKYQKIFFLCD